LNADGEISYGKGSIESRIFWPRCFKDLFLELLKSAVIGIHLVWQHGKESPGPCLTLDWMSKWTWELVATFSTPCAKQENRKISL